MIMVLLLNVGAAIAAGCYGHFYGMKSVEYASWPAGLIALSGRTARLMQHYGITNKVIKAIATICCKIDVVLLALLGFIIPFFDGRTSTA